MVVFILSLYHLTFKTLAIKLLKKEKASGNLNQTYIILKHSFLLFPLKGHLQSTVSLGIIELFQNSFLSISCGSLWLIPERDPWNINYYPGASSGLGVFVTERNLGS